MANHRLGRVHIHVDKDGTKRTIIDLLRLLVIEEGAMLVWHILIPIILFGLAAVGVEIGLPFPGHSERHTVAPAPVHPAAYQIVTVDGHEWLVPATVNPKRRD